MSFRLQVGDGPTLKAGLVALWLFRGSGPVLLINPSICDGMQHNAVFYQIALFSEIKTNTKQELMYLAEGHNAVWPVIVEPATLRSRVKQSTTVALRSLSWVWGWYRNIRPDDHRLVSRVMPNDKPEGVFYPIHLLDIWIFFLLTILRWDMT